MNRFTHAGRVARVIDIPAALAASLTHFHGPEGHAFLTVLPRLAAAHLDRWDLRPDGPPMHGRCALVLPVTRADGTPAALKLLGAPRAPWLAIDPKPLAGDPGFELWPALVNRFDPGDVRRRFDAMTDVLALDRTRARAWTLARLLQTSLWSVEKDRAPDEEWLETGRRLRD
ncbi:aminoglycoside phosphotransferase family protein [Streptomyces griseosporeus]|uniref:aminoglycoside phosphotransferase family protein n=1 Tax=Streptomyces griseosporeus TaxID=1910 RepID=UPI00370039E5